MNEKLIEILLEKIEKLEEKNKKDSEYINALENERVRLNQINDELEEKLKLYE